MKRTSWLAEGVVALAALVCYLGALPNDFCDDGIPIVALNPQVQEPGHGLEIWTTDYWHQARDATPNRDLLYRPLAIASYRAVRVIGGDGPFPQLLVNVFLHALVSVLVVRLSRLMGAAGKATLVAGGLFAVLPIHSEVIANVVGRADLLAAACVLLAILAHGHTFGSDVGRSVFEKVSAEPSRDREGAAFSRMHGPLPYGRDSEEAFQTRSMRRVCWVVLSILAAFAAMASKESGVAVVVLVPLFHWLWMRSLSQKGADLRRTRVHPWYVLNYLLIPTAIYFALRYHALEGHLFQKPALTKTVNVLVDAPGWQHLLGVVQLWGMYWAKTLWPDILTVNYSINAVRLATSVADVYVLIGLAVLLALLALARSSWRRGRPTVAILSAAMVLAYAPTANAFALIQVFFAERIWYLPSVFLAILLGKLVAPLLARPAGSVAVVVLILGMSARCWIRSTEWRDNLTLYAAAHRDHPNGIGALRLYGQALVNAGRAEEGIEALRNAIDIDLGFTDAHRSLGQACLLTGDYESAVRYLQTAEMQIPHHPPTVEALARAKQALTQQHQSVIDGLTQRAATSPNDEDAEIALLRELRDVGQIEEALARLRAGEGRFADRADWQYEYAQTLLFHSELDRAIERYETCVRLAPMNVQWMVEAAMLLLERKQGDDLDRAWNWSEQALILAPSFPPALVCRAELLAVRGDLSAAANLYRRAIRAVPPDSAEQRRWEQRARALGK